MRKTLVLGALSALVLILGFVPAADAAAAVPTCLIANDGGHGHFTYTLTCVELVTSGSGHAASGRYSPGAPGPHRLTVSLEYQEHINGPVVWVQLAAASAYGSGDLNAITRSVHTPPFGQVRACVTVVGFGIGHEHGNGAGPLCTST